MCHLILLMPILALPVFWMIPVNLAVPIYSFIVIVSVLLYRIIAKSMSKKPETGSEGLIGTAAEVVSRLNLTEPADYMVRIQGELWNATSPDILEEGEKVNISAVERLRLVVQRSDKYTESIVKTAALGKEVNSR